MQFAKILNQDRYVEATQLIKEHNNMQLDLVCPRCYKPVVLRVGKRNRPHFSHISERKNITTAIKRESDLHKDNKYYIYQNLAQNFDTYLEQRLPNGERRADVLVMQDRQNTAIELQYSLVNSQEVLSRQLDYEHESTSVLWLLGKKSRHYEFNDSHFARLAPFVCFNDLFGFYLPYWDEEDERVLLLGLDGYYQITKRYVLSITDYLLLYSTEQSTEDLDCFNHRSIKKHLKQDISRLRQQILTKPNKQEQRLMDYLKNNFYSMWDLPATIHHYINKCLLVEEPLWIILAYVFILQDSGVSNDGELINHLVKQLTIRENIHFNNDRLKHWLGVVLRHIDY